MHVLFDALLANALVALFLALLAALISLRVRRPALVHAMWLIVLLKLVTPPLFSIHWPASSAATTEIASQDVDAEEPSALSPAEISAPGPTDDEIVSTRQQLVEALVALRAERESVLAAGALSAGPVMDWRSWPFVRTVIGILWLGGTLIWLAVFVWRIVRFHRLLGLGHPADDELQAQAGALSARIGLARCPEVWIVPGRVSPLLWVVGRKRRLVLPERLLASLNRDQRAALLAHEMAHAHRLDHWVRWVELCALGLYWWNPVVWWARRELHQAEEECCDAWVVWILPGAARAYAKALLQTVTFLDARPCLPPVASGAGHVSLLKRRLSMIVNEPLSPRLPKPLFFAALLWGAAVLPFAPARVTAGTIDPGLQASQRQSSQSVEQRIKAIEEKLDKVLNALDSQNRSDSRPRRAATDDGRRDELLNRAKAAAAEERAKTGAEQAEAARKMADEIRAKALKQAAEVRAKALEQAAEGRAAAEAARKALESARKDIEKQAQQARTEVERATRRAAAAARAKSEDDKDKSGKDDKKSEKSERRVIVTSPYIDAKTKADIERIIKEKMGEKFKPEELKKMIQETVDPAKMKQLQVQIQDIMRKTMDEKRREMDKTFDELRKSMESQRMVIEKKQAEGAARQQSETRARTTQAQGRDNELRDVQRRLERLEQRLDKVISSLESQQRERRSRPDNNRQ